jgi:4-aminobutyrate aminotransferase-like enzyme
MRYSLPPVSIGGPWGRTGLMSSALSQNCESIRKEQLIPEEIRPPQADKTAASQALQKRMGDVRGRPLLYPMFPTGRGSGPFFETEDGAVKLDLICGIGVALFGYHHRELFQASVEGLGRAPFMHGTLMPGHDHLQLSEKLLAAANGDGLSHLSAAAKARMAGVWLTSCGTMANELALKILRQKHSPKFKLISFKNAFAGRSTAMQELTDEPKYREGQPTFGQFTHIPFFDERGSVEQNLKKTTDELSRILDQDEYAGFGFEPIQGEGGAFRKAPVEWWRPVLEFVKKRGLAVWMDEVQCFGRTGEYFAFQRLGLGEFVDVLSVAKPLQCGAVLWSKDYVPKPGLIAGTFSGSGAALAAGAKVIDLLRDGKYLGPSGKIVQLEKFIERDWEERRKRLGEKYNFGKLNICGGMIAVEILDGKAETIKNLLNIMFEKGVLAFSAGKDPVCLRFLPPMGVLAEAHWKTAMTVLEESLQGLKG